MTHSCIDLSFHVWTWIFLFDPEIVQDLSRNEKKVCSRLILNTVSLIHILCNNLAVKIDYTCFEILLFVNNISDIKMQLHKIVILLHCWCGMLQCSIAQPPYNISLLLHNNQTYHALVVSAMVCSSTISIVIFLWCESF